MGSIFQQQEPLKKKIERTARSYYRDGSDSMHALTSLSDLVVPDHGPRIALIDDDPIFGKIMERVARSIGAELQSFHSLDEFPSLTAPLFDVAVVDYDLGLYTGIEAAAYLEGISYREIPVVLVSQNNRHVNWRSPPSIREFVPKQLGPAAILDAAFEACEIERLLQRPGGKKWAS